MRREVEEKLGRIRRFLKQEGYDGVLLTTNENFCWLSGGRSAFVDKSTGAAASKLMVTESGQYVICNSSERYRVMEEELPEDGFELITYQWHEDEYQVLADWIRGKKICKRQRSLWDRKLQRRDSKAALRAHGGGDGPLPKDRAGERRDFGAFLQGDTQRRERTGDCIPYGAKTHGKKGIRCLYAWWLRMSA